MLGFLKPNAGALLDDLGILALAERP